MLLTIAISPGSAVAKSASPDPAAVVKVTLTAVSGGPSGTVSPMAAGEWNAGCQYSAFNALGQVIYSYTTWQQFATDGSRIYYYPAPTYSASAYWGWALTSAPTPTHWWVTQPTALAARGSYTFTQYVGGQPFQSASGWVQVTVYASGTWGCLNG